MNGTKIQIVPWAAFFVLSKGEDAHMRQGRLGRGFRLVLPYCGAVLLNLSAYLCVRCPPYNLYPCTDVFTILFPISMLYVFLRVTEHHGTLNRRLRSHTMRRTQNFFGIPAKRLAKNRHLC